MDVVHRWRDAHHDHWGFESVLTTCTLVSGICQFEIIPDRSLSFVHNWYFLSGSLNCLLYLVVNLTVRSFSVVLWAEIVEGARRYFPWTHNWVAVTLTYTIWASQTMDCAPSTLSQEVMRWWAMLCGDWEVLLGHQSTVIVAVPLGVTICVAIVKQDWEDELAWSTLDFLIHFCEKSVKLD